MDAERFWAIVEAAELTGIGESEYCDLYEASTRDDAAADRTTAEDGDDEEAEYEYGAEIDPVWLAERLPRLLAMFYPELEPPAEVGLHA